MTAARHRFANSLTARTIGLSALVAVIAALVTLVVSFPLISQGARAQAQDDLARLADVSVAAVQGPADAATIARLRSQFRSEGVTAYLVGPGLAPVADLDPGLQREVAEGSAVSTTAAIGGQDNFVAGRPVGRGFALFLVAPIGAADSVVGDELRRLLVALVVGVSAAAVIGLLAARRVTRPLRRAAETAERLSAGERGLRLDTSGPTEVGDIAESLNRLGDSLATSEGRQREFLVSVSHELRTPLTSIRGYSEALADGMVADTPATGAVMADEAKRLDRLVTDLLDLARLGAVDVAVDVADVDLTELVSRAERAWRSRCEDAGVPLRLDVPDTAVVVRADPDRVRQIVDNLAENALRVTPAGSPIVFAAAADGAFGLVSVRDGGPGLDEQDMVIAFEPAALHARYRGIRSVGTGVGLALVGRLAARMGGEARVWSAPEGGAAFGVRLPRPPAGARSGPTS